MGIKEDFFRSIRAKEYEEAEEEENILNEEHNERIRKINEQIISDKFGSKKLNYMTNVAKSVIAECVADLYMKSLIIDNPEDYESTLKPIARMQVIECLREATDSISLHKAIDESSIYIQSSRKLINEICNRHYRALNEEVKTADDPTSVKAKEFDKKVLLDKDDLKLIKDWEDSVDIDIYANDIQDRIVKVYKGEEEAAQKQKEKIQNIVNELSKDKEEKNVIDQQLEDQETQEYNYQDSQSGQPLDFDNQSGGQPLGGDEGGQPLNGTQVEAIQSGINCIESSPKSIFSAIFLNKSRAIMNENSGNSDMDKIAQDTICETICTYTLLECIHALGLHTYTYDEKLNLIYQFAVN